MRKIAVEILSAFVLLIISYLLLVHASGFSKNIAAIGDTGAKLARTFQGR